MNQLLSGSCIGISAIAQTFVEEDLYQLTHHDFDSGMPTIS
jgi:hypothetical protein